MYTTYESIQWRNNCDCGLIPKLSEVPEELPKPEFMPTKLIRTSDMQVVQGSQVNEGYCALSYSWNQTRDTLLIVGRNAHIWKSNVRDLFSKKFHLYSESFESIMVRFVLYYAHMRTSTKDHDRVFSRLSIFSLTLWKKSMLTTISHWKI
ncbi:hypothetical protein BDC45DRAFT_536892 [Circinella umbellata]|nr:hypothetical protein BDC45DRAFT_536892 [Circinella umbellata]